jgi:hypothetical protein
MDLDDVLSSRDSEDKVDEEELQSVDEKVACCTRLVSWILCPTSALLYVVLCVIVFSLKLKSSY